MYFRCKKFKMMRHIIEKLKLSTLYAYLIKTLAHTFLQNSLQFELFEFCIFTTKLYLQFVLNAMSAPSPAESTPLNHQSTTNCSAVSNGGGIFSKYPVAPNMFTSASSMMAASNGNPFGISFINGLGGGFGSRNSTSSPPKSKRCRQRVDAGEPRHFYQQQQQQQQQQVILFES